MATVKFYLRRPKEKGRLKATEVSVFLKFTLDKQQRFELNTDEKVPPVHWNFKRQEAKPTYRGHIELNQSLLNIKAALIQLWRENKTESIESLQEMARPLVRYGQERAPEKKTIFPILAAFISQYEKDKDPKTVAKYRTLESKLKAFDPHLQLNRLDNNFCDAFKDYLYSQDLYDNTVAKTFTNLSTFLTWAAARGHDIHHTNNKPTHTLWKLVEHRYEPITLTLAELEKLETLQINEAILERLDTKKHGRRGEHTLKALTLARDIFILECRTCQRISDLKRFKLEDVHDGIWHNAVKKGNRLHNTKTKIPLNVPYTLPAWRILESYNFQIPTFTEQKVNKHIKTVCMLAGIDQHTIQYRWRRNRQEKIEGPKYQFISTHNARKTFITLGLQYMLPKHVKDIAGITWETLKHYEGQVEEKNLVEAMRAMPGTAKMKIA